MARSPSPPDKQTMVLGSVKRSLAPLGGFATLDPACAPWS